jgi:hypothetical protein
MIGHFIAQARRDVDAALAESEDRNAKTGAAYVLARLGEDGRTKKILDELDKELPADTLIHGIDIPRARRPELAPQCSAADPP